MTFALDATYSLGPHPSGIGVYCRELLAGVARAHPEAQPLFCYRWHAWRRAFRDPLAASAPRRLLLESTLIPPMRLDLFHGLNQRLPRVRARRRVATFHDLFVMTGDYSSPEFRARFTRQAREAAKRADCIIAVSSFTARQVEELLSVSRQRVRVVPHGVRSRPQGVQPREKIVLHVGAIQRRKNIVRLVEGFEHTPPGWRLALAGSAGFEAGDILRRIEDSPRRSDIEVLGYVPDAELGAWYSRASLLAFPSLDEGFGMPALEAMAAGTPVLASTRGALPEVCGDAALLVEATDSEAIGSGLNRLIKDEDLCAQLRARGLHRAAGFTWERAATETWQVYEDLLGSGVS